MKKFWNMIFSKIKNIDDLFMKRRIWQIICAVLVLIVFIIFIPTYSSNHLSRNYRDGDDSNTVRLNRSSTYTMSFEAKDTRLDHFHLNIDPKDSSFTQSDRMHFVITDDEGSVVCEDDAFIYNAGRTYVNLKYDGKKLKTGDWYYLTLTFGDMKQSSRVSFISNKVESFNEALEYAKGEVTDVDDMSLDHAIGISKVINIDYYYSSHNTLSMIIHLVLFIVTLGVLFFERFLKSLKMREIYRAVVMPFYLYLTMEVLNIEKQRTLSIFFPLTLKQYYCVFVTILVFVAIYIFLYSIIGRGGLAFLIECVIFMTLAFVNHTKLVMRGDSFMPWDVVSAGIAVKTGSTYYFHVTRYFICGLIMCAVLLILIRITSTPYRKFSKERASMIAFAVLSTVLVFSAFILNKGLLNRIGIYYKVNPPIQSYNENGTALAFLMHLNNIEAKGGSDSSPEQFRQLIWEYSGKAHEADLDRHMNSSAVKPNVICIMSEAYADLEDIGYFETSEPVMPFFDSLKDKSINGHLAVSIFGGGTCNTEFEFLTGYSMDSLLPGASVYTFYINGQTEALPSIYRDQGYRTVALHPFDGDWWDRREKYPLMGFDEFYTRDDFPEDAEYVRRYISDNETFGKIESIFEESEQPLFLFCVTMQNHADFADHYDNMKYDIKIPGMVNEDGEPFVYAENYVSLLRESDDALKGLITYLENSDEPTVVVFFGDHCPPLDPEFYDTILQTDIGSITIGESLPIYETPYFIWANYDLSSGGTDIDTSFGDKGVTSPNFLGQTLLYLSGMPSPESRACLRLLMEKINAESSLAVFDKENEPHFDYEGLDEETLKLIEDYSSIQYGLIYYDREETS